MYGFDGWHMAGWGGFGMFLVWLLTIVVTVWLVREFLSSDGRSGRYDRDARTNDRARNDAETILRERFAKGEIDAEEYRERISVLEPQRDA